MAMIHGATYLLMFLIMDEEYQILLHQFNIRIYRDICSFSQIFKQFGANQCNNMSKEKLHANCKYYVGLSSYPFIFQNYPSKLSLSRVHL